MDSNKLLEELRLKSLTVNKYIKENKNPIMTSPAAAAGASGAGGGKKPAPAPGPDPGPVYPIATDVDVVSFLEVTGIENETLISTALETMVTSIKTANVWEYMKGLYPFVTNQTNETLIKNQFKVNLKDRKEAQNLTEGGTDLQVSANGISNLSANGNYRTPALVANGFTSNFPGVGYCKTTVADTAERIIASSINTNYYAEIQNSTTLGYAWDTAVGEASLTGLTSKGVFTISSYLNPEEAFALRFQTPTDNTITEVVDTRTGTQLSASLHIGNPAIDTPDTNVISTYFYFDAVNMLNTDLQNLYDAIKQFNIDLGRL